MTNELEKSFSNYLKKNLKGYVHRKKMKYYENQNRTTSLSEEHIAKSSFLNYLLKENSLENIDVSYSEPEKVFSNYQYYIAMKKVPLKQKQALYLLVVDEYTVNEVSKILNTSTDNVYKLKQLAIKNFKKNLEELNE